MATTFRPAEQEANALLNALIVRYRPDLDEAWVTLLFAFGDAGPALTHRGQAVLGRCKINNLQDRVEGKGDATITVDGDRWADLSDNRRRGLLHHELSHIRPWSKDDGTDDIGRPALKSRHGDWEFDGFYELLEIYGEDAPEAVNLAVIAERRRQGSLLPAGATGDGEDDGA